MTIDYLVGGVIGFLIARLVHGIAGVWRTKKKSASHRELVDRIDVIASDLEWRGLVTVDRDSAGHVQNIVAVNKDGVGMDGSGEYRTHSSSSRVSQSDQHPRF